MNNLTREDYNNIIALINRANLTGAESTAVAILLQKLGKLLAEQPVEKVEQPYVEKPVEKPEEKK